MNEASEQTHLKAQEHHEAEKRSGPESVVLYQAVVLKGEHELNRPATSLWWSGISAGLAVSASLIAEGALHHRLPEAPWRELITGWGYSVGFIIVILGRMQLFTEHTVIAVMPALGSPSLSNLHKLARLWLIVLLANQIGAFVAALSVGWIGVTGDALTSAMIEVSRTSTARPFAELLLQSIPAGFLIAAIAWLIVAARTGHFWIVALLAYVIAIGQFPHVVASAASAYLLALTGNAPPLWPLYGFVLPTLIGNIIGGTGLFALLNFGQVKEEI